MVEISLSGVGEDPGSATAPGFSTRAHHVRGQPAVESRQCLRCDLLLQRGERFRFTHANGL